MTDSYYADTSSIRKAGRSLASLLQSGRLRTSVLSAIELLNGVTTSEDEFRRRRAGLQTLNGRIDGRMPEQVIFSGFQALVDEFDFIEKRLWSLEIILNTLDHADTLADFRHDLDAATLGFPLDYFASYDQKFESVFGRVVETEAREVRRLLSVPTLPRLIQRGQYPAKCCQETLRGSATGFSPMVLP